jgi:hypothetical protein
MPDFNIRDRQGNKIGSIEQKGPGLVATFMAVSGAIRSAQINDAIAYVESINQMFTETYEMLYSFEASKSNIDVSQEIAKMLETSKNLTAIVDAAPDLDKQKKFLKYFESNFKLDGVKAIALVESVLNTIGILQELNRLFHVFHQYFELHNASCDRLESEGFYLSEITDVNFLALEQRWTKETDQIIDYYNEILDLIDTANSSPRSEFPMKAFDSLLSRELEMTNVMKACLIQTDGRENAARRLMDATSRPIPKPNIVEELQRLVSLKQEGHINQAEFDTLKKKLI